ncbi:MAG: hypothetical protein ACQERJ_09535, partial [Bacillota bacterium]
GTILSLIYYLKVIRVLYQKSEIKKKVEKNNLLLTAVATTTTSLCLILGFFPAVALNLINQTVVLLGG